MLVIHINRPHTTRPAKKGEAAQIEASDAQRELVAAALRWMASKRTLTERDVAKGFPYIVPFAPRRYH
jgi:hypothetical protein